MPCLGHTVGVADARSRRHDDPLSPIRTIRVPLYGPTSLRDPNGMDLKIPQTEAAILALLCAVGRPIARRELVEATATSPSTLRPLLSRLPRTLGLSDSIHVVARSQRSGLISPNRKVISDDAFRIQETLADRQPSLTLLRSLVKSVEGPILHYPGLVQDHPLVAEAISHLTALRNRLYERKRHLDAQMDQANQIDLDGMVLALSARPGERPSPSTRKPSTPLTDVDLLRKRAEANINLGYWNQAAEDFQSAIEGARKVGDNDEVARLTLQWARIAWDPETGQKLDDLLNEVLPRITRPSLLAQVKICQAGGTYQTGVANTGLTDTSRLFNLLNEVEQDSQPEELAWSLVRTRRALVGLISPGESLALADSVVDLAESDPLVRTQGLQARFVDLLCSAQLDAARSTLDDFEGAGANPASAMQAMVLLASQNCWDLASGCLGSVQTRLTRALEFRQTIKGPTVDQVIMAQSTWLAVERQDHEMMTTLRDGANLYASSNHTTPLWPVVAAWLEANLGQLDQALAGLASALKRTSIELPPKGPHRPGILALTAEVLGRGAVAGLDPDPDLSEAILSALHQEPATGILLGWPAVYLGSKHRFLGLAALATNQKIQATQHFNDAIEADRPLPALCAQSFDALALTGDPKASLRAIKIRDSFRTC